MNIIINGMTGGAGQTGMVTRGYGGEYVAPVILVPPTDEAPRGIPELYRRLEVRACTLVPVVRSVLRHAKNLIPLRGALKKRVHYSLPISGDVKGRARIEQAEVDNLRRLLAVACDLLGLDTADELDR